MYKYHSPLQSNPEFYRNTMSDTMHIINREKPDTAPTVINNTIIENKTSPEVERAARLTSSAILIDWFDSIWSGK